MTPDDDEAKSVLQLFCEFNGIPVPDDIEDDVIAVDISGVPEIWLSYLQDGELEVYAEIDGIDIEDPGILRLLLEANFMGMSTDGARLCIDPVSEKVVLSERWNYEELLAEDALEALSHFALMVASWRNEGVTLLQSKARGEERSETEVPQDAAIFRL